MNSMCKSLIIPVVLLVLALSAVRGQTIRDGYTDKTSYYPGENSVVYFNASSTGSRIVYLKDIHSNNVVGVECNLETQEVGTQHPWKDGFGYKPTFTYEIPALKSGLYFWDGKIPFIIKDDSSKIVSSSQVVVVLPTNTDVAYNNRGGKCFYPNSSSDNQKADTLSLHRPYMIQDRYLALLRWLWDQSDLSYSYIADMDMDEFGSISAADLIIISGHSEYWTRKARRNFDRFVDLGKPALVLSGNSMWWQVRYTPDREKLICHKLWESDSLSVDSLKTVLWTDDRLGYQIISSIGADFHHGGYGLRYDDNGWDGYKLITTDRPYLSGLNLHTGQIISMPSGEYDGTLVSGRDSNGFPIPDTAALGFFRMEIIGFDLGFRVHETIGTWIEFQKTVQSGVIINVGSIHWGSNDGIDGTDGELVKQITRGMINYLLDPDSLHINVSPYNFTLYQNYPNPFNSRTTIQFAVPVETEAALVIYDLLGKEVVRLVDRHLEAKNYLVSWNGMNSDGRTVSSGIYIARLLIPQAKSVTPKSPDSIKMMMVK